MEEILKILSKIKPNITIDENTELIESGILTSFEILRLVIELNEEFDINITPLHTLPENFKNAKAISELVERLEEEG